LRSKIFNLAARDANLLEYLFEPYYKYPAALFVKENKNESGLNPNKMKGFTQGLPTFKRLATLLKSSKIHQD
jgi:hypothetical protein